MSSNSSSSQGKQEIFATISLENNIIDKIPLRKGNNFFFLKKVIDDTIQRLKKEEDKARVAYLVNWTEPTNNDQNQDENKKNDGGNKEEAEEEEEEAEEETHSFTSHNVYDRSMNFTINKYYFFDLKFKGPDQDFVVLNQKNISLQNLKEDISQFLGVHYDFINFYDKNGELIETDDHNRCPDLQDALDMFPLKIDFSLPYDINIYLFFFRGLTYYVFLNNPAHAMDIFGAITKELSNLIPNGSEIIVYYSNDNNKNDNIKSKRNRLELYEMNIPNKTHFEIEIKPSKNLSYDKNLNNFTSKTILNNVFSVNSTLYQVASQIQSERYIPANTIFFEINKSTKRYEISKSTKVQFIDDEKLSATVKIDIFTDNVLKHETVDINDLSFKNFAKDDNLKYFYIIDKETFNSKEIFNLGFFKIPEYEFKYELNKDVSKHLCLSYFQILIPEKCCKAKITIEKENKLLIKESVFIFRFQKSLLDITNKILSDNGKDPINNDNISKLEQDGKTYEQNGKESNEIQKIMHPIGTLLTNNKSQEIEVHFKLTLF